MPKIKVTNITAVAAVNGWGQCKSLETETANSNKSKNRSRDRWT